MLTHKQPYTCNRKHSAWLGNTSVTNVSEFQAVGLEMAELKHFVLISVFEYQISKIVPAAL
jgi:hypothetical protein